MGLLNNPRDALAAQIRAQYQTGQGGSGSWDDAGQDRALELADLLIAQGITDLGDLSFVDTPFETQHAAGINYDDPNMGRTDAWTETGINRKLKIGDKEVGFLGDVNNDGSVGANAAEFLKVKGLNDVGGGPEENLLGWSATGDGNTSYRVITDPATGKLVIAPGWNSSSDAENVRNAAIAAAAMYAGGYGISAMGAGAGGLTAAQEAALAASSPEAFGMAAQTGLGATEAAAASGTGLLSGAAPSALGVDSTVLATMGTVPEIAVPGMTAAEMTMAASSPLAAGGMSATQMAGLGASGYGAAGDLGSAETLTSAGGDGLAGAGAQTVDGSSILNPSGYNSGTADWWDKLPDYIKTAAPYLRAIPAVAGAIAGSKETPGQTSTTQRTMDPRLDARVFGDNGLLSSADQWFQQNKATGQNDTMRAAQNNLRGLLQSPFANDGISNLYGTSQGLLNGTWRRRG